MKIELHTHTSEGSVCGLITASELVQDYLKAGVDCIVITNHYSKNTYDRFKHDLTNRYLLSYKNALQAAKGTSLLVLFGMELNLANHPNDYLILGIKEDFLDHYPMIFDESLETVAKIIHNEGGLILQAHPFRKPCKLKGEDCLDGYEFNMSSFYNNHNDLLENWIIEHEESHAHLIYTYGSDCHGHDSVGAGIMEIEEKITNNQELVAALKQHHNNVWRKR